MTSAYLDAAIRRLSLPLRATFLDAVQADTWSSPECWQIGNTNYWPALAAYRLTSDDARAAYLNMCREMDPTAV